VSPAALRRSFPKRPSPLQLGEVAQACVDRHTSSQDQALEEDAFGPPRLALAGAPQVLALVMDDGGENGDVEVGSDERPLENPGPAVEIDHTPETAVGFLHDEGVQASDRLRVRGQLRIDEPDGDVEAGREEPQGPLERARVGPSGSLGARARNAHGQDETNG
jgi:hypothetical protein